MCSFSDISEHNKKMVYFHTFIPSEEIYKSSSASELTSVFKSNSKEQDIELWRYGRRFHICSVILSFGCCVIGVRYISILLYHERNL